MNLKLIENFEESDEPQNEPLFSPLIEDINSFIPFISSQTGDTIKGYFNKDNFKKTLSELSCLQDIWKRLLVDAIHFLKINDKREREYFYRKDNIDYKTTMSTEGAKDAALYNVYGVEELHTYFKQFSDFESTLYGADKYYRDHVIHPLKVWLIGLHILKEYGEIFSLTVGGKHIDVKKANHADPKPEPPQDRSKEELYISTAEISALWTIIALTHDLGYPLEKVEKINDQLETMLSQFGKIAFSRSRFSFQTQHDHLIRFLLKLISSQVKPKPGMEDDNKWVTRIRTKYHTKFAKSWEMFDHGIVSSLILLKSLTFFIESDFASDTYSTLSGEDVREFTIRSEILHAIASHTTPKIYHLAANNLSFLLVLCDELQEWGRPRMTELRSGSLKGSAQKVEIKECIINATESEITCYIKYDEEIDKNQQYNHAKRIFKKWHERLRPAVYDVDRKMRFIWEIEFKGNIRPWKFELDTNREVFQQMKCEGLIDGITDVKQIELYSYKD
jgi:hypothetical protein